MSGIPFTIVDVFSEGKYTGNQLAVFQGNPPTEQMQRLALEMGFAETTFITSDAMHDGGWNVRIFTPAVEMPFAGHPTLGTAYVIRELLISEPVDQVVLNLKVGQIPVSFSDDGLAWMRQNPPSFGSIYPAEALAAALSLSAEDVDTRYPVQVVDTGVPFVITALKTRAAVERARLDRDKLEMMLGDAAGSGLDGVLFFAPEPVKPENDIHARMLFADALEVGEDAATGSANGCLASWLVAHRYYESSHISKRVEQGYGIGRPSLLLLDATDHGDHIEVNVGGQVELIAQGHLVE